MKNVRVRWHQGSKGLFTLVCEDEKGNLYEYWVAMKSIAVGKLLANDYNKGKKKIVESEWNPLPNRVQLRICN